MVTERHPRRVLEWLTGGHWAILPEVLQLGPRLEPQGLAYSPASDQPVGDSGSRKASHVRPFGERPDDRSVCYLEIRGAITRLSFCARPSTIVWRISQVIVDPVQRVLWRRPPAHVGEKVFI